MNIAPSVPNHHADYPGFAGPLGFVAGLSMTFGRTGDADLAERLTGTQPGDRVVDVGCGPGTAIRHAARLGATVTGVDPAPVMLRLARRLTRARDRITLRQGTAEALPLPDGSATVLWSIATVHHWSDLDRGLGEIGRVLEAGGRFVAIERRSSPGATVSRATVGPTSRPRIRGALPRPRASTRSASNATRPGAAPCSR